MKYFVLIPDGMADEKIDQLGNVTPMQKANKRYMDLLASRSTVGLVSNVPDGMVPESDTANMAILSFDPKSYVWKKYSYQVSIYAEILTNQVRLKYSPMMQHYRTAGFKIIEQPYAEI